MFGSLLRWCVELVLLSGCSIQAFATQPFRIEVIDESNGWPVPLVELRTTHSMRFVSDNAGVIAFDVPELMNQETWLHIEGHGYGVQKDGFGYRGVRVTPRNGEAVTIKVRRELAAKRLGRITGGGLFAESQKLGEAADWTEQRILGCDSVQNCVHNGKLHWGWGDTVLAHYPLGRFHMIGATTVPQPLESFKPPVRLRYDYVTDESGVPRNIAKLPGDGPTWLSGYASLPDRDGKHHLVATYAKITPPLSVYERGLCEWNEATNQFQKRAVLWQRKEKSDQAAIAPVGHTVLWTDDDGKEWALFGDPFPTLKCPATFEQWSSPANWHAIEPQESVSARDSNQRIRPHRGAIAWSEYRKQWVTIFTQLYGDNSALGEIWYAESDSPMGPWRDAVRVVTHNKYTFYNPQLHPEFTPQGSPILLFEATFTHTFSKTQAATPRCDYNQVLYRLDLDEL
jgi:hypothetical protein